MLIYKVEWSNPNDFCVMLNSHVTIFLFQYSFIMSQLPNANTEHNSESVLLLKVY